MLVKGSESEAGEGKVLRLDFFKEERVGIAVGAVGKVDAKVGRMTPACWC